MIKKIEDMDFYELLNLRLDASPREIENAYLLAVATYHRDSLASYGVLGDAERGDILDKIEDAFQTLHDPLRKKDYDTLVHPRRPEFRGRAYFRSTTSRLEIEDAAEEENLWDRVKAAVIPSRLRKGVHGDGENGDGQDKPGVPDSFFYYGDYLRKVREKRGLTREDVAARCGLSPAKIESLEEESLPSPLPEKELLEDLRRYARCLGLNPENGRGSPLSDRFDE
jgi:curved DNA-binding protein CbpA